VDIEKQVTPFPPASDFAAALAMLRRAFALVLVAIASETTWYASAQSGNLITDPEVYAVYASTPWSWLVFRRDVSRLLIVEDTRDTGGGPTCFNRLPADWSDVAQDYRRQNAAPHRLLSGFDLGLPYDLLSSRDQRALDTRENEYLSLRLPDQPPPFPNPYAEVPEGKLIYLSAVGFNAERTRAMFRLSYTCGGAMCAEGWQLRRIKENGVWRSPSQQAEYECMWIS